MDRVKELLSDRGVVRVVAVLLAVAAGTAWLRHNPPVTVGDEAARKVVILLHGFGANKEDLSSVARHLQRKVSDFRFVMPEAPHSIMGGYAWIPSFRAESQEAVDAQLLEYRAQARAIVVDIIDDEVADGVRPQDIYVGGFSQGAAVALDVLLSEPAAAQLGGLVFLSGGGLELDLTPLQTHAPLRAFVSHARQDPRVGIGGARELARVLEETGHYAQFAQFESGHTIPPEVIRSLRAFLFVHD